MLALSWTAAFVACFGYGIGSVLQSVGARRTRHVAGVGGMAMILFQLPYLIGLTTDGLAFVANVVALQQLPLFLVQSIMTASVGVTAVIASLRGERLDWKDWASLGVLAVGLVVLSLTADSENAVQVPTTARWVILASGAAPLLVGLVGRSLRRRSSALVLAFGSGLAYSGVAVASRGLSGVHIGWQALENPLVWTIVIQGVIGTVFFALALQRGPVTAVTAITFVAEMVFPSIVGLLLFGDGVHSGLGWYALGGFGLAIGGTVALMRFAK